MTSRLETPFYAELIIQLFRLAVRIAHASGGCDAKSLLDLLRVALVEEFDTQGLKTEEVAMATQWTKAQINAVRRKIPLFRTALTQRRCERIVDVLEAHPEGLTERDLLRKVTVAHVDGRTHEHALRTILSVLSHDSIRLVEDRTDASGCRRWFAVKENQADKALHLHEKLSAEAQDIMISMTIARHILALGRINKQVLILQTCRELRHVGEKEVATILDRFIEEGSIVERRGYPDLNMLELGRMKLNITGKQNPSIDHAALLQLITTFKQFMESFLSPKREAYAPFGQRTYLFRGSKRAISCFLKAHNEWVRRHLIQLEEDESADPNAQLHMITWQSCCLVSPDRMREAGY